MQDCHISDTLKKQIVFLGEADKMKSVMRKTMLTDLSRQESDADHSWHISLMAMTLFSYVGFDDVDLDRVIRMTLVHDLVEIYAGDTYAYDDAGNADKEQREKEAADRLFSLLPDEQAHEYRSLWEEFDAMQTHDAMYASAVDRLQPLLNNYLTSGHTWDGYNITAAQVFRRMDPVRIAIPAAWPFVEYVISDSLQKGYLLP